MKTLLLTLMTCFVLSGSTAFAEKIAYVDVAKVFDAYEKTKSQDSILEEQGVAKQAEREEKVKEVRRLKDELFLLSDDKKEEKQNAIDEKIKALQDFELQVRKDLGKKRDEIVKEILKDIDETIKDYGLKQGYDFIVNERALLYSTSKADVTDAVLETLNSKYNG